MTAPRKYIEVLAFVAVWMAAGWTFRLDANAYLVIGVPLVVLFQLLIRRQPLRNLWARDATSFRLGLVGVVIAALLILAPGYDLVVVALPRRLWVVALWLLCACGGAVFAAFALRQQEANAARRGLPGFIAAVLIGIAIMAAGALARHHSIGFPLPRFFFLLKQFLLYFVVSFALEEVAFRGALDSHLYQPGNNRQSTGSPWLSAIFVCSLGSLAFAGRPDLDRTAICSGHSSSDHCSHLGRSAAFLLLASQWHFSLASSGPFSY